MQVENIEEKLGMNRLSDVELLPQLQQNRFHPRSCPHWPWQQSDRKVTISYNKMWQISIYAQSWANFYDIFTDIVSN